MEKEKNAVGVFNGHVKVKIRYKDVRQVRHTMERVGER